MGRTKCAIEIRGSGRRDRLGGRTTILVALLGMVLAACAGAADTSETTTTTAAGSQAAETTTSTTTSAEVELTRDVLKIGAAVSSSGNLAQDGANLRRGYELWAQVVNDAGGIVVGDTVYTVELVFYDDESNSTTAANLADRLITEDEVDFIFGPFSSGLTLAVGAITERHGKVLIMPAGNSDAIYAQGWESAFGMLPVASSTPQSWLDLMLGMDPRPTSIAIITKDEPFALSQSGPLTERVQAEGMDLVFADTFPPDTQDFSATVSQLRTSGPELVVLIGHTEDNLRFLRALRDQQFSPLSMLFTGGSIREMQDTVGDTALYAMGIAFWSPLLQTSGAVFGSAADYAELFEETYPGVSPHWINALGAAAGVTLQLAIEAAQSVDPTAVREALRTERFETFFGPVEFDERGLNVGTRAITEQVLAEGEVLPVGPVSVAAAEAVYPMPGWTER